jgi:site-specific DNA-methyltransferase (adenine-specific)
LGIRPVADFETLNYQIMTDLNTSTEATITDETAIGFIPCYRLPFLSLFHADCMEIMKQYPNKYFDLAIVDPPYGIGEDGIGKSRHRNYQVFTEFTKKGWDSAIPDKTYFDELFRISKDQIIWGGNYFVNYLQPKMGWIFWSKLIGGDFSDGELAYTSFNRALKMVTKSIERNRATNAVSAKKWLRIHPCQKPVYVYEWILKNYVKNDFKIIDTHFGSGSIALAVDKANRLDKMNLHLTACEIDKEYIDKAIKRISESIKQGTLSF